MPGLILMFGRGVPLIPCFGIVRWKLERRMERVIHAVRKRCVKTMASCGTERR
jgi:hypothetical protein